MAALSKGELARGAQRSCNVGCAGNQSPCRYVNRRNPTARGSSALDTTGWTERRTDIFTAAFVRLQGVKLCIGFYNLGRPPTLPKLMAKQHVRQKPGHHHINMRSSMVKPDKVDACSRGFDLWGRQAVAASNSAHGRLSAQVHAAIACSRHCAALGPP